MDVLPESLSSRALASYWKKFENKKDFISLLPPFEVTSENMRDYRLLELKWTILKVMPISVLTSLTLSLPSSHFWVTQEWYLSLQLQGPHSLLVTYNCWKTMQPLETTTKKCETEGKALPLTSCWPFQPHDTFKSTFSKFPANSNCIFH